MVKTLPDNAGDAGSIAGPKDNVGKEMATHSSIPAWDFAWTEEPDGLQSMGLQKSWTRLSEKLNLSLNYKILILEVLLCAFYI